MMLLGSCRLLPKASQPMTQFSVGEEFKCNLNLIRLGLNQKPIKLTTVVLFSILYLL